MLGGVNGTRVPIADYGFPLPLGAAEHRSCFRKKARACLTERSEGLTGQETGCRRLRRPQGEGQGWPETNHARRKQREAQGSRSAAKTKPWGAFSFGYFSLRHGKEK
jgi:hypothetical protein